MNYSIGNIASIVQGVFIRRRNDDPIQHLITDSRRILFPKTSLFFALTGSHRDGHDFIADVYKLGVRSFIVSKETSALQVDQRHVNIILVEDTLKALQLLAGYHRSRFSIPVIGITGSNGKTIVKEWLNQMLEKRYKIIRSPRSYNSQIGVPLSVWQMSEGDQLAIFEAGISEYGDMDSLTKIIKPTIGIITNVLEAHSEGFSGKEEKINEKLKLFYDSEVLISRIDDSATAEAIVKVISERNVAGHQIRLFDWSTQKPATFRIFEIVKSSEESKLKGEYKSRIRSVTIPFSDDASIENAIHCWCLLLHFSIPDEEIAQGMLQLQHIGMRLELKKGVNNCSLINDTYSADQSSLNIALDFLMQQHQHPVKTVILSDILQSSKPEKILYEEIAHAMKERGVHKFIGIGEVISAHKSYFENVGLVHHEFYLTVADFKKDLNISRFRNEAILIKGARKFQFEQLLRVFELQLHQTVLEINLNAIVHNLNEYRKRLSPSTRVMAMVKAFSYGGGSYEIASVLQFHKVDFLAVAYADEGIELRKGGISLPIMVMNADPESFESIVQYNLEPELYSNSILQSFNLFLTHNGINSYPVHLEVETGMNRLGFSPDDLAAFPTDMFRNLMVRSVFTHLVASEDPAMDDFTFEQASVFERVCKQLASKLNYTFLRHIVNSSGAVRHKKLQMDMVRLGIGLYGIGDDRFPLKEVSVLKSTIAQLKMVTAGETVSYGRSGIVKKDSQIATVRIGYADGYPRVLGNGKGYMLIKDKLVPTIGNICMDMTMIDVTGIPGVEEGEEVIVFGNKLPVQKVAEWAGTIPYEILTGISQRVQRIYFEE